MTELTEYIEENTLRLEASRRGGGIEIDASDYLGVADARMTAYQNYLGGGLLGSIGNSFNGPCQGADAAKRDELAEALRRYYFGLTQPEAEAYDEWAAATFDGIQRRPASAY